jgi:hypothetical protein
MVSGMFMDDEGISHGEEPSKHGCSWQLRFQEESPDERPVFACERCERRVCYCGGHGCAIAMGVEADDFCDDCCPCEAGDADGGR